MSKKYQIEVYSTSNPAICVTSVTNQVGRRLARLKHNIKAAKGEVSSEYFTRFDCFKNVPWSEIAYRIIVLKGTGMMQDV